MFCALIYVSAILIIVEPLSPCKPRGTFGGRWMLRCWGLNGEKRYNDEKRNTVLFKHEIDYYLLSHFKTTGRVSFTDKILNFIHESFCSVEVA